MVNKVSDSLSAFLSTPTTTRIFLAASADDVAKVVYALTRALPQGLLDHFTFSTYESDPLSCSARLVGHESGSAEQDLPNACYLGASASRSFLDVILDPGTYWVQIDGYNGDRGPWNLDLRLLPP